MLKQLFFCLLVFLLTGIICCEKKRNSPFCYSCETGVLVYPDDNPRRKPLFIKQNGDSLNLLGAEAKVFFQPGGINVCVKMKRSRMHTTDLIGPVMDATCIKKTD